MTIVVFMWAIYSYIAYTSYDLLTRLNDRRGDIVVVFLQRKYSNIAINNTINLQVLRAFTRDYDCIRFWMEPTLEKYIDLIALILPRTNRQDFTASFRFIVTSRNYRLHITYYMGERILYYNVDICVAKSFNFLHWL